MLTLADILGDHPPTDPDGFLNLARLLRFLDIYAAVSCAGIQIGRLYRDWSPRSGANPSQSGSPFRLTGRLLRRGLARTSPLGTPNSGGQPGCYRGALLRPALFQRSLQLSGCVPSMSVKP